MRFSDYHRLDIRIDGRYYFKNWSLVTYFDIMNVYGGKTSGTMRGTNTER